MGSLKEIGVHGFFAHQEQKYPISKAEARLHVLCWTRIGVPLSTNKTWYCSVFHYDVFIGMKITHVVIFSRSTCIRVQQRFVYSRRPRYIFSRLLRTHVLSNLLCGTWTLISLWTSIPCRVQTSSETCWWYLKRAELRIVMSFGRVWDLLRLGMGHCIRSGNLHSFKHKWGLEIVFSRCSALCVTYSTSYILAMRDLTTSDRL